MEYLSYSNNTGICLALQSALPAVFLLTGKRGFRKRFFTVYGLLLSYNLTFHYCAFASIENDQICICYRRGRIFSR